MNTTFQITSPRRTQTFSTPQPVRTRGMTGTMTYRMKQHPTSMYILPLKKEFTEFKDKIHDYSIKCYLSETMPQMVNQLTLVTKSFENFIEMANTFYQGVDISPRGRTSLSTSALQKGAKALVENWMDFIEIMNSVFHTGISQFYSLIPKYFNLLQLDLDETLRSFDSYGYKTDVPAGAIRKLKLEVQKLKVRGNNLCEKCNPSKRADMESGAYQAKAEKFIKQIYKFFNVSVPKQTITSGLVFKVRTKVYQSCGELDKVISGAKVFGPMSEEVKECIINFNDKLENILNIMEFPFTLSLNVEKWNEDGDDDDCSCDEDIDDSQMSPEKQIAGEHINKLKDHIKSIDAAIDDAQEYIKKEPKEDLI